MICRFALLIGIAYLTVAGLGFIPALHTPGPADAPRPLVENGYGYLLDILPNNIPLNVVHLAIGIWGVAAYRRARSAGIYARGLLGLAGALALAGALPALETLFGLMPLFGANVWLHALTALGAAFVALVTRLEERAGDEAGPPGLRRGNAAAAGVASTATIAGRPLHPALVPYPLAFLSGALATDLAYWWTTLPWYNDYGEFLAEASLWLIGAGLVTGVLAAVPGAVDFLTVRRAREAGTGRVHALGNVAVLALALANLLPRRGDAEAAVLPWGLLLSALTALLLAVTGCAGSDLVRRHLIGVTGCGSQERQRDSPSA